MTPEDIIHAAFLDELEKIALNPMQTKAMGNWETKTQNTSKLTPAGRLTGGSENAARGARDTWSGPSRGPTGAQQQSAVGHAQAVMARAKAARSSASNTAATPSRPAPSAPPTARVLGLRNIRTGGVS